MTDRNLPPLRQSDNINIKAGLVAQVVALVAIGLLFAVALNLQDVVLFW